MLQMRNSRIRKMRAKEKQPPQSKAKRVTDKQLFASMGVVPKVVRVH